ncbi:hypothetical protein L6164_028763 [Bauhinia variegata]|uniref:Uncharacterized protein n=1 Tax=Bauhinia variegata TaxID=167791 RepID=A0ACB9L7G7_BAUVA|nr:hypothetical protein L6164_028763 [Bauhinia variegata]
MNPSAASATDFMQYNGNGNGSDSDANPDDEPEYYQPISAVDDDGEDGDVNSEEEHHHLPNGYCLNGISSLDLTDDVELKSSDDDEEEEEEEEERIRQASELAIHRAFIEDENRRNMPLPAENAVRVMEAMRGVSFGGTVPDWAGEVPEDRWIDHVRRLRQPPNNSTSLRS